MHGLYLRCSEFRVYLQQLSLGEQQSSLLDSPTAKFSKITRNGGADADIEEGYTTAGDIDFNLTFDADVDMVDFEDFDVATLTAEAEPSAPGSGHSTRADAKFVHTPGDELHPAVSHHDDMGLPGVYHPN